MMIRIIRMYAINRYQHTIRIAFNFQGTFQPHHKSAARHWRGKCYQQSSRKNGQRFLDKEKQKNLSSMLDKFCGKRFLTIFPAKS